MGQVDEIGCVCNSKSELCSEIGRSALSPPMGAHLIVELNRFAVALVV
jgi:hypothetical protein